ncbi:MAG TPA: hypothetical protein VEZ40_18065 [Pyrinomonadaceae bacterium]|nr:hypothetical protein [Pyrinomonadaceae bacterium]
MSRNKIALAGSRDVGVLRCCRLWDTGVWKSPVRCRPDNSVSAPLTHRGTPFAISSVAAIFKVRNRTQLCKG